MASLTPLEATDLLNLNAINLDVLTENYELEYYIYYLQKWPSLCFKVQDPNAHAIGYMLGKSEGTGEDWHSHISAVTVEKDFRRLKLGKLLVDQLRLNSDADDQRCFFMDLYVRTTNHTAVQMYRKFGFSIFRRVVGYYGDGEDAYDMRLPLLRDTKLTCLKKTESTGEESGLEYDYNVIN